MIMQLKQDYGFIIIINHQKANADPTIKLISSLNNTLLTNNIRQLILLSHEKTRIHISAGGIKSFQESLLV